jgi:uncharacterized membrane protein
MARVAIFACTLVTALGAGVMAGVFFAFSTFVMRALARLPPAQGLAAMQSINVAVVTPSFLGVFLGTAVTALAVALSALTSWEEPGARYRLLGSVLYLFGVIGVSLVFNIPRNEALAALEPTQAEAARPWARYVSGWTAWNHVRMVAALGALTSYIFALRG